MQEILKKYNFRIIFGVLVTVVVLLVLARIISLNLQNQPQPPVDGNPEIVIEENNTFTGNFVVGGQQEKQIVTITVDDVNDLTTSELESLKRKAAADNNLNYNDVIFVLESRRGLDSEYGVEFDIESDGPDPTDPTKTQQNSQVTPNTSGEFFEVNFEDYADSIKLITDRYEVYKIGDKQYEVLLKQGYTQSSFEQDFFYGFPDYTSYQMSYIDEARL